MYSSMFGIIPCVLLTVAYLSGDSFCGHGSLNTLDKQLLRILQHYPNGIPPAISERLQKVIESRVQPSNTNATDITKLETKNPNQVISNNTLNIRTAAKLTNGSLSGKRSNTVPDNITQASSKNRKDAPSENRNVTKALVVNISSAKNENKINVVNNASKRNATPLTNKTKTHIQGENKEIRDTNAINVNINTSENRNVTKTLAVNISNAKNDNEINVVNNTSKSNVTQLRKKSKTHIQVENNKEIHDQNAINVNINTMETVNKVNGSNLKIKATPTRNPMTTYTNHNSLKNVSRKDGTNKTDHLVESSKRTIINNITKTTDNYALKEGHIKSKPMMAISVGRKHHNPDTNATANRVIQQKRPVTRQEIDAKKITTETGKTRSIIPNHISKKTKSEIPNHKSKKTKSEIFNHKAKATVLQPHTKIGKNYAKTKRSNIGVRPDLRKIKIRNGLTLKAHHPKTKKHHQSPKEPRKHINIHSKTTGHAYKPKYKTTNPGKGTQSQHLKFNRNSHSNPFSNLHSSLPDTNVRHVKTRQEEMSTKIFSFSSPRTIHQNVPQLPQKIVNPVLTRNTKKKFSLTPPENQLNLSRNSRNMNTQKHSTTKTPNSWKRPVPEIQMMWENKPIKNGQFAPPTNSLNDQRNPSGFPSNHYYYDSINFQDTFQIDGPYPQSNPTQSGGSPPMWKQQSQQNKWTSSNKNNQMQFQNQQNNERLKISFQDSNTFDKSNAPMEPFQNYPGQYINNNARSFGNYNAPSVSMTDVTPGPWSTNQESMNFKAKTQSAPFSPQQSVVYSNFKDNPSQQGATKNNQQRSNTIQGKLSKSGRPSVVYSKFETNHKSNSWNTMNQHSQNNQGPNFPGGSGNNLYTTTISPYLYPAPSPSMFAPPNRQGKESLSYVPTFTQDTLKGKQNLPGWNAFTTTPAYKKQNSVIYSKTPQNPQMNKKNSFTDITIAPNYLFHQEQTSQYPILKSNSFFQGNQMTNNVHSNQGIGKTLPWSSTISPISPTTPSTLFTQQGTLSTKSPDQWVMAYSKDLNSMDKNSHIIQTTIPPIIAPLNQRQQYPPQQHHQSNFNGFEQQPRNNFQQKQFAEPFQAQLNQNFQQQQNTQIQVSKQPQQTNFYQNGENMPITPITDQQQQQPVYGMQNNKINNPQASQFMSSGQQQTQNQHFTSQMYPSDQNQQQLIIPQNNQQRVQVQNVNYLAHDQNPNLNQQQQFNPQQQSENTQIINQNQQQNQQLQQNLQLNVQNKEQQWTNQNKNNHQYQNQQNSAQGQSYPNQQANGYKPNQPFNVQNQQVNGQIKYQNANDQYSNQPVNGPYSNQRANGPNTNQQANGPNSNQPANRQYSNQQANDPYSNQYANGPYPNQHANGPNSKPANGPHSSQQTNGPYPNQRANGKYLDQQPNRPNSNQPANGPYSNQPPNGPYQNQQANGPYPNQPTNVSNSKQQAFEPNYNQPASGQYSNPQAKGPYPNQQANVPNSNQQANGANSNQPSNGPYPNQQTNGANSNQRVNGPYSNQQANGPYPNQQANVPKSNQQANGANSNQPANGPYPNQQAMKPNQNQQANGPTSNQQVNEPNKNQQINSQNTNQQGNRSNTNQQTKGQNSDQKANGPNPNQPANGPYLNQQANRPNLYQQANGQNFNQQANGILPNQQAMANGSYPNQYANGPYKKQQTNGAYPNQPANGQNANQQSFGPYQYQQTNARYPNQQPNGQNSFKQPTGPYRNQLHNGPFGQQPNAFGNQNQQQNSPNNQIQPRQPLQQQRFPPQQRPQYQQPQKNGNNNRNMKIFTVNQNKRRQRQLRIPAPAYLTFGVYYPDGSTTEEEHQLAGKHVHTITRYNADKVDHISDYLTMDHTWNTLGLVSQGNNQDTCYVGKLQNDIMKSYEIIVNKTRFSDIPFIEANDKDILYNNVRPIDYNQAVNEVGQFVADSCGHRANIFLVTRSRHRQFMAGRTVIPPTACAYGPPQHSMKKTLVKCYNGSCQGNFKCNVEHDVCCPKRPNGIKCRKMSIGNFCVIHPQYGYYAG
nr:uncharacterized protein DDB_G0283357 [Crassostrea gigas]